MVIARRLRFAWIHPLAACKSPRAWIFALGLGLSVLPGGEARTQSSGCARCGGVLVGPPAAMGSLFNAFRPPRIERVWREERPAPERRVAGGGYTVCVRACDGSFFPVAYSGAASRADGLENVCRSLCPNAEVALYSFPLGGTIDQAVSSTGEPYDNLPNAHKFEHAFEASCSCRAPGQSWAEALARAEAKYGRHAHDIFVTAEIAERLSRPARGNRETRSKSAQTPWPRRQRRRYRAQRRRRGDEPRGFWHSRRGRAARGALPAERRPADRRDRSGRIGPSGADAAIGLLIMTVRGRAYFGSRALWMRCRRPSRQPLNTT